MVDREGHGCRAGDVLGVRNLLEIGPHGKGQLEGVKIAPEALADKDSEMLEDLILLASNRAREDAEASMKAQMADITGGLELPPGMNLPF